ncbi:FecR domain-containing protein [uncultured Oscillibacter sp.]|uniref:FecR domain-containing protein n=1 Tax=uncultured Oscillibacter sp. TaxID=876091 RepID=UPI0025EB77BD|nr:FecR domain-containing protein [uncultured Oscillibacter sp.]
MRRTASLWMALLLVWSLMLPAAAETAAAATLRLEKAEGTVTVSTAAGRTVSTTDGMRLYSGYVLETGTDSYAYVSLDSTKAVKLDASSRGEVSKSGKKLELKAVSGKLFFNVTAPVKEDESLNIRTSTMVTGVRGTAGWVEVVDRSFSRVHLLEGTLTVTAAEPSTGELRRTVITGGQTVTAAVNGASRPGQQTSLTVAELREEDVPAFVAVELAKDPALQEKVAKNSPLSVEEIIRGAEDRLREEQAAADAAERALRDQLGGGSGADQVFPDSRDDADSDDRDSGGSSDTPVTPPAPEPPVTETVRTLDDPTAAELTAALNESGVTRVYVTNAGKSDRSDLHTGTYHVGGDQTLTIQSGTLTVGGGKTLTVEGTMVNAGGLSIIGTMDVNGSFTNDTNGQVLVTSEMSLHVNQGGTMVNRGTVTVAGGNSALLEISGELYNDGAVALGNDDGSGTLRVTDTGVLTNTGTITVRGKSIVFNTGRFENGGRFSDSADSNALTAAFTSTGTYTDIRTDTVYAIAKEPDGRVRYLGPLTSMPGWYVNTAVTLMGGKSVAWNGRTEEHQVAVPGVTLDLNGRIVELGNVALTVAKGGELTVKDGDSAGGGALTTDGEFTLQVSGGALTLESGSILNTRGGDGNSGGTAITTSYSSGGTVNIHGGTVRSENDFGVQINGAGTLKIAGGSVVSGSGTAVALQNDKMEKSAEISGGSVLSERGTAVLVSGGALRVTGGSITGWTGGIFNQTKDSKNVTISGGVITLSADSPSPGKEFAVNAAEITGGTLRAKDQSCIAGRGVSAELPPPGAEKDYYVCTVGGSGTP